MSWCTINQWGLSIPILKDKIEKNIKKKRKKSNYLNQLELTCKIQNLYNEIEITL